MYAAFFPSALFQHYGGWGVMSHDVYEVRANAKPAFVISAIGQVLWTKYYCDPNQNNVLGEIYWNGVHQQFQRKLSGDKFDEVPMWQKAAASPYFHLIAGHPENTQVPVWATWGATNSTVGSNLTIADNDPFKV